MGPQKTIASKSSLSISNDKVCVAFKVIKVYVIENLGTQVSHLLWDYDINFNFNFNFFAEEELNS